ncbi:MAG: L-2-hydroxyglutarate oxidase [Gemmatimonadaceae bacterium]|nr:L-2-hydroxyglutarate oxidase [Gemmatimonadaceae bacterium]
MTYDVVVIGGGIVGLAAARAVMDKRQGARVLVVDKESRVAFHQTGHNSGVIHSGVYYKPGSLKARLAVTGSRRMVEFCAENSIRHEICGKVIVATRESELPGLDVLIERGKQNAVAVSRLDSVQLRELEPSVRGVAALHVPNAGIADYVAVSRELARQVDAGGGEVREGTAVRSIRSVGSEKILSTSSGEIRARFLVNCAGLQSDRVARMDGVDPRVRIIPFKGEYFNLVPGKRSLVRNLIYPVPNPDFPFLGVHFTRMVSGEIHAGPNAVLSLAREGYRKAALNWADAGSIASYAGFWRLAAVHWREGVKEMARSASKARFVESLRELIPEIREQDIVPATPGIRAQAVMPDGKLCDDFVMLDGERSLHVVNAPSPAATASLEIGRVIAERVQ